jgi:Concanavalin A-like lectin/glucanases superfamily
MQSIAISVDIATDVATLASPLLPSKKGIGRPTNYARSIQQLKEQLVMYGYLTSAADCAAKTALLETGPDFSASLADAVVACGTFLADNAKDISTALKTRRATPGFTAVLSASGGAFSAMTEEDKLLAQAKAAATTVGLVHDLFNLFLVDPLSAKFVAAGDLVLQFLNARISAIELERAARVQLDDTVRAEMTRYNEQVAKIWRAYFISYMELFGNYYFRVADGSQCPAAQLLDAMGNCTIPIPTPPSDGLVGRWNFDTCDGTDSSASNRPAVITGSSCVDGKLGKAIQFSNPGFNTYGGSDWVTLPSHTSASVTFSAWVKWNGDAVSGDGFAGALWSLGVHTVGPALSIWINEGSGKIWTDWYTTSPHKLTPGIWAMLTIASDGLGEALYLNGELINAAAFTSPMDFNGQTSYLSHHFWDSGQNASRFRGVIDDARMYSRALTATEVRDLYLSTR